MTACPVCAGVLSTGLRPWHWRCATCGHECSTLTPAILAQADGEVLDEVARAQGLQALRNANFERILARLRQHYPAPNEPPGLLDVGCAHGWFIEQASPQFAVTGIEPDAGVAAATRRRGLAVREGFFPEVLQADERFDVIVFNDVLEHIADIHATLMACRQHLRPGGWVVINAPSRRGFLYRLSKGLLRCGAGGAFERLWQHGFPSPHLHYFDGDSVRCLAQAAGLQWQGSMRLPVVSVRGLYARIRYPRDVGVFKALALTVVISAVAPLLAVLPADIECWWLRRPE